MAEFLVKAVRSLIVEMFDELEFPMWAITQFEEIIPTYIASFNPAGVNDELRACLAALVHIRTSLANASESTLTVADLWDDVRAILHPPKDEEPSALSHESVSAALENDPL